MPYYLLIKINHWDLCDYQLFHFMKQKYSLEKVALINNPKYIKRSKILRDKGTNRDEFNRNIVKKYSWVDIGSSFGMSEISAAFLYAQLLNSKKLHL